ncbi:MAG: Gfo/Idh/MocA family oxidoreductase [Verrucomicrobia bacterium]|nr:Gfo/Idh/MocA family oxidoreductase [Verrucomicrobiota bacterium]
MTAPSSSTAHRVLIIGLGQIGLGYDLSLHPAHYVLTHARAFSLHPSFTVVGGVDPSAVAQERFTRHYAAPAFAEAAAAVRAVQPDIVVVATPTAHHLATVRAVLAAGRPHTIVCEKPLAYTLADGRALTEACASSGCRLYVNYMRRSDPTAAELRARVADGRIATPLKGVVWYAKGLYNNGSHFINLLEDLLGPVLAVERVSPGAHRPDGDPEPDFTLRFSRGPVTFVAARADDYVHNTIEWIAPNGRLRYERAGASCHWEPRIVPPVEGAPARLAATAEPIPEEFAREQAHFVSNLADDLNGQPACLSRGTDALATLETLVRIQPTLP